MATNISDDFIGQRTRRLENLKELQRLGINPYPARAKKEHSNSQITSDFDTFQNKTVTLAGRLMRWRTHGKIIFGDLQDESGTIQFAIRKDALESDIPNQKLGWEHLKFLDIGDIVQLSGQVDNTKQGEITLFAASIQLLAKSIRPYPQTFDDKEQQFRKRYIDLVVNEDRKRLFQRKSKFWDLNRSFLLEKGFTEVETPVLEFVTGGADARPFSTYHNDLDQNFYLRISTELYQKRLIGGGFEKIFTIGPNFRNEGISDEHLQEYYQVEWYWAYADYRDNMNLTKEMFRFIAKELYAKTLFTTRGHSFDLADDWEEIDYASSIKKHFDIDIFTSSEEEMLKVLKKNNVDLSGAVNRNRLIDNLWKLIRKTISGPAFLINEPAFMSPLAKAKADDPRLTERFHIILAGSELGNGYTEINDPQYQLDQFLSQQAMRAEGDEEAQMLDLDYVEMLEYAMPPTSGYGHSERLFWFLEDVTGREGTLFPQLRHDVDPLTKEIYKDTVPASALQSKAQNSHSTVDQKTPNLTNLPSREEAHKLLEEHVTDEYQRRHAQMVASAMEMYAKKYGENENLWYITGLLHDLDYHEYPDEHPNESLQWFKNWNYPEEMIHAVAAHAFGSKRTDVEPKTRLDYTLIACDELSGLLYAYSLMRPERFEGMSASSAMKKFKNKSFAAKVDREEIKTGVEGLGIELKDHMQKLIEVFSK